MRTWSVLFTSEHAREILELNKTSTKKHARTTVRIKTQHSGEKRENKQKPTCTFSQKTIQRRLAHVVSGTFHFRQMRQRKRGKKLFDFEQFSSRYPWHWELPFYSINARKQKQVFKLRSKSSDFESRIYVKFKSRIVVKYILQICSVHRQWDESSQKTDSLGRIPCNRWWISLYITWIDQTLQHDHILRTVVKWSPKSFANLSASFVTKQ